MRKGVQGKNINIFVPQIEFPGGKRKFSWKTSPTIIEQIKQNPVPKRRSFHKSKAETVFARKKVERKERPRPEPVLKIKPEAKRETRPWWQFTFPRPAAPERPKPAPKEKIAPKREKAPPRKAAPKKKISLKERLNTGLVKMEKFGEAFIGWLFAPHGKSEPVPLPVQEQKQGAWNPLYPVLSAVVLGGFSIAALVVFQPKVQGISLKLPEDAYTRNNLAAYAGLVPAAPVSSFDENLPLNVTEAFAWESYMVQGGDSVSKIAAKHALSMDAIIASNGITNARKLAQGDVIKIPNMDGIPYTVKQGDSLSGISTAMGVPLEAILDANDIQTENITAGTVLFIPGAKMRQEDLKNALGDALFIYPIRGRLTSNFGWRNDPISGVWKHHGALDLAAPTGTLVKASMDGKVSMTGNNANFGKYIILTHRNGYQTMYAHLNAISVKKGAEVSQGGKIGEVGSTGYSTGPHLHFAVFKNNRAVNPLELLNR